EIPLRCSRTANDSKRIKRFHHFKGERLVNSNVVPFFNDKSLFKKQRRKNTIPEIQSYHGSNGTLTWDEAVDLFLQAKRTETASPRTVDFEKENLNSYRKLMLEQGIEPQVEGLSVDVLRKHFVAYMVDEKKYALNT